MDTTVLDVRPGPTDARWPLWSGGSPSNGGAVVLFQGAPTNVTFALTHEGRRQQLAAQNIQSDAVAYFRTVKTTLELKDSTGAFQTGRIVSDSGAASTYCTNIWRSFPRRSSCCPRR